MNYLKRFLSFINRYKGEIGAWLTILTAITILITGGYWSVFNDNPPVTVNSFYVSEGPHYPGDTIDSVLDLCKHTDAPVTVHTQLKGETNVVPLPSFSGPGTPDKTCKATNIPFVIPLNTPPGTYTKLTQATYHVNPIADRHVTWESQSFEVLPPVDRQK